MNFYRFSLPSRIECAGELRGWVAALASMEHYGERFASELELGVHEAFVNAVVHGNRSEPELPVVLTFEVGRNCYGRYLDVRIRDCGEGFDPASPLAAACSEAARSRPGGRGLLLMSHYAESLGVERLPNGCVVFLRYIPD
ncbi:MAG: ATP-binding protein [Chlorobiaceae bacterium]|nr:ATP-binding protein [Chlorobiaceae bacterium]